MSMRFVWDQRKNKENIRRHGIDFRDAIDMFHHPMLIISARKATNYEKDEYYKGVSN